MRLIRFALGDSITFSEQISFMIKIREVFTAKPGMASKMAKLMIEDMKSMPGKVTVMTDMTGEYNTVVVEYDMENLTAFDKMMQDYMKSSTSAKPKAKSDKPSHTDMYLTGRREIFRIWN